ncbi:nuclear transport factor 2 [Oryza brachyantha]|uniref:NTF2 domain-containing protein n=1 Tax=Oryza brachyantha TaxID=4533 RepID=J3MMR1_ORYBR|nr:nuclear transport factor 2 [Oryza brachyantha]
MAMQVGDSVAPLSPQMIGNAFVQQYYNVLHSSPGQVHKFYHDSSTLGRPDSNGAMTSVTTISGINDEILSTDFSSCLIKLENVDAQSSLSGGVLILVTGSFDHHGTVNRKFSQSFFLAPQESGGYFVLNDMLRYLPETPSTEIKDSLDNHVDDNTHSVTTSEPETSGNVNETADLELPSAENVNDKVENLPANDNSPKENVIMACTEVVSQSAESIPEPTPAPHASAQKDVTKQSYASIVKVTKESTATLPVAKPKPKPKPKSTAKVADNAEKSVSSPVIPHATDTTSPKDKTVLVEHGYSVFVKNLPCNSTVKAIEEKFSKFGAIRPGGIQVRNRQPDGFCFGFVEFESRQSMVAAIEASPITIGSKDSIVEEKRTTTRVVNGVTHAENNGIARGGRFQQDRGGYRGDNFRGREAGFMNGNYRDGDNMRNGFRNQNEYSGHGRGPQGNGYHQNGNGYHQNGNGYHPNGNRYQNRNGYHQNGDEYYQNGNAFRHNGTGYYQNGNGYRQERSFHNGNGNGRSGRFNGPRQTAVQVEA